MTAAYLPLQNVLQIADDAAEQVTCVDRLGFFQHVDSLSVPFSGILQDMVDTILMNLSFCRSSESNTTSSESWVRSPNCV